MPSLGGAIACMDDASPRLEKIEIYGQKHGMNVIKLGKNIFQPVAPPPS